MFFFFKQKDKYLYFYFSLHDMSTFATSAFNHTTQVRPPFLKLPPTLLVIITAELIQPAVGSHQITHGIARDAGREPPGALVRAFLEALQATQPEFA